MNLDALTYDDIEQVREWRNVERQFLRTPHILTESMQLDFYEKVVNNRESAHRYYALVDVVDVTDSEKSEKIRQLIGMGGITNIEWENGIAEISLIINPDYRGKGLGMKAVGLLYDEAIGNLGLRSLYGEVYDCGNRGFWEKVVAHYDGYKTDLVKRKRWGGHLFGSMWFCL